MNAVGDYADGSNFRPGHYTVKSKKHGFECLRCGKTGYIRDIMETECPNPNAPPNYHDESINDTGLGKSSADDGSDDALQALQDELWALEFQEEEYRLLESLEALEAEKALLETQEETNKQTKEVDLMVGDLVTMGFDPEMASLAIQESKGDWTQALDLCYQRIQKEEHEMLEKAEKEEKKAHVAGKGRMPATPCTSTSMPPPPLPAKKKVTTPEISI